jgi:hypothetical protein
VHAATLLLVGFNALAPGLPRFHGLREVMRSIPEAHLIEYGSFYPGPLFHSARLDRFHLAAVRFDPLAPERVLPPSLQRSHADAVALLRGEEPALALTREARAAPLARETGALPVWRSRGFVLLANSDALRCLEAVNHPP